MSEMLDLYARFQGHQEKWRVLEKKFDFDKLNHNIDESRLTFDNLNNLTEIELIAFMYKIEPPKAALASMIGFTIGYYASASYLMYKTAKPLMEKFVPKYKRSVGQIVKWGNLHIPTNNILKTPFRLFPSNHSHCWILHWSICCESLLGFLQ
jgi:hypothetical protein